MISNLINSVFGSRSDREIKLLYPIVDEINQLAEKLKNKSCDWIVANEHYNGKESVFDSDMNSVKLVENDNLEDWGYLTKNDIAEKLCLKISKFFNEAA